MRGEWNAIKSKLGSAQYEADAADWAAMQQKIAAEPGLRSNTSWLIRLGLSISIAFIATSAFFGLEQKPRESKMVTNTTSELPLEEHSVVISIDVKEDMGVVKNLDVYEDRILLNDRKESKMPEITTSKPEEGFSSSGRRIEKPQEAPIADNKQDITSNPNSGVVVLDRVKHMDPIAEFELKQLMTSGVSFSLREVASKPSQVISTRHTWRLQALSLRAGITALNTDKVQELSVGLDLDFQRKNFFFSPGLQKSSVTYPLSTSLSQSNIHRQLSLEPYTKVTVDSTWVLQGPMQGYYRYDTTRAIAYDSIHTSSAHEVRLEYISLPLVVGYRYYGRKWSVELGAGVRASFLSSYSTGPGELDVELPRVKTSIVLRPGLGFSVSPRLGVLGRLALYQELGNGSTSHARKLYGNLQLGLTYRL